VNLIAEKQSPLLAEELVACEVVQGADFGCVWHFHAEVEITLVQQGGTERWVGDKFTPLKRGDLVILGPDLPHDYRNDPLGKKPRRPVKAVVVQFGLHLLGENWFGKASMEPVRQLFHRARLGLEVTGSTRRRAAQRMTEMAKTTGLRRVVLLLELLEDLAVSKELAEIASPGFQPPADAASSDRIGTVCAHIEQHLSEQLYVTDFAQLTGLSESAFSRLFKRCTGRTVPRYVNELRIARACRLLAETDQSVKEITDTCGYASPANFQRQFQLHQHQSPLAYRHAIRGGN
jgi:AraC-like DNA-binding protein